MGYFAVCSFDLKNATNDDYKNAYSDLAKLGFSKQVKSSQGTTITLPTTTTVGQFNGASAGAVRDDLTARIQKAFEARRFRSEVFISVGGDWAWSHRTS